MSNSDRQLQSALISAARSGRIADVQIQIDGGADLDRPGERGGTAVCWAAAAGHAHIVDLLLASGANRYLGGGPGRWAYQSEAGIQWDVLSVTRAAPEVNAIWRSGGLPIERRDNYTMTEMVIKEAAASLVQEIYSRAKSTAEAIQALVSGVLDWSPSLAEGPVVVLYSDFQAAFSSYFENGHMTSVFVGCQAGEGTVWLPKARCGSVMVKGPLTQLGFAHYSLRLAATESGLKDPRLGLREIYHYYEAADSDANIVELQLEVS